MKKKFRPKNKADIVYPPVGNGDLSAIEESDPDIWRFVIRIRIMLDSLFEMHAIEEMEFFLGDWDIYKSAFDPSVLRGMTRIRTLYLPVIKATVLAGFSISIAFRLFYSKWHGKVGEELPFQPLFGNGCESPKADIVEQASAIVVLTARCTTIMWRLLLLCTVGATFIVLLATLSRRPHSFSLA